VDYQSHKQRCHPVKIYATENAARANNDDALERLTAEALKLDTILTHISLSGII